MAAHNALQRAAFVERFCAFLSTVPGIGHARADHVQSVLLDADNHKIVSHLIEIAESLVPEAGMPRELYGLIESIRRRLHHQSSDHAVQRTLREWLDKKKD